MRSRSNVALIAALLVGCGNSPRATAGSTAMIGYEATGVASWYGEEAAGHFTASGARFDPDAITAAHRSLPLGSLVEVTALDTGRSIVALVNDRGPGRADRLIDLSRGAARLLGTDRRPLAAVRIRVLAPGSSTGLRHAGAIAANVSETMLPPGRYVLQIASFSNEARARDLAGKLKAAVIPAGELWRVRLGPLTAADAQRARDAVAARGYADARLVPVP